MDAKLDLEAVAEAVAEMQRTELADAVRVAISAVNIWALSSGEADRHPGQQLALLGIHRARTGVIPVGSSPGMEKVHRAGLAR